MRVKAFLVLSTLLAACSAADSPTEIGGDGLVFLSLNADPALLSQNAPPLAVMDALYEGRVSADANGCIRLESSDRHTVIWPYQFKLSGNAVLDADGRTIGTLGGQFKFGGGEVASLENIAIISDADRARAQARCPGRFWIVGEILN